MGELVDHELAKLRHERNEAYGRVADYMVARRAAELRVEDMEAKRDEAQAEATRRRARSACRDRELRPAVHLPRE